MRIHCQNICPEYLDPQTIQRSEIWNKPLELKPAQGIIIWGPSGRGKSTFLRILFGLEKRFSGKLQFDSPARGNWPQMRQENLAFVSQSFRLFNEENGWKNLHYLPTLAPGVDESQIHQWAQELEIEGLLERTLSTWSHGQRQRFTILRALASPFRWILLDEPVSHLDAETAQKCLDLILEVCRERKSGWIITQQTDQSPLSPDQVLQA